MTTKSKKILIVDDEPDILEFLSYNFRKKQFIVSTANNGIEGIEVSERERPDIIISDILMPEMNGIIMSMELRKKPEMNDVPILFLSAAHEEYQFMLTKYTMGDHYLSKPIRFDSLLEIVNQLL